MGSESSVFGTNYQIALYDLDGFRKRPGDSFIDLPSRWLYSPRLILGIIARYGQPNPHNLTITLCLIDDPFHLIGANSAD
jgi:hypothetical protein